MVRTDAAACGQICRDGGVVLYPTEAVWGLGCDPRNEVAVRRVLALKGRPAGKGLILIAGTIADAMPYLDISALDEDRWDEISSSWPGPHTWVIPSSSLVPAWVHGDFGSVAVRVSAHPQVRLLCESFGSSLVSTSANLSGGESPFSLAEVPSSIISSVDAVCAGETLGLSSPSSIRDAVSGTLLRG